MQSYQNQQIHKRLKAELAKNPRCYFVTSDGGFLGVSDVFICVGADEQASVCRSLKEQNRGYKVFIGFVPRLNSKKTYALRTRESDQVSYRYA